jgi:DNA-binding CsgD family transcriptional regulator
MEVLKKSLLQAPGSAEHFFTEEHTLNFLTVLTDDVKEYTGFFTDLLRVTQTLCGQTVGAARRLCLEVAKVTRNRVQLDLDGERNAAPTRIAARRDVSVSFPVCFQQLRYGVLYVAFDAASSTRPALPLDIAHALAHLCGLLLYTLEITALIQREMPPESIAVYSSLTRRQHQILLYMMRGCDQDEIAEQLSIAPATVRKHMQNIYQELGVHGEREAVLVAYQARLISPIDDLPPLGG